MAKVRTYKNKKICRIYFYYPSPRASTTHDEIGSRAVKKKYFPICWKVFRLSDLFFTVFVVGASINGSVQVFYVAISMALI